MAANPKDYFIVCLYIYVSVIHRKTNSGQYGHIPRPSVVIGIYVTWSDWDHGCSSVRLQHIAQAMVQIEGFNSSLNSVQTNNLNIFRSKITE